MVMLDFTEQIQRRIDSRNELVLLVCMPLSNRHTPCGLGILGSDLMHLIVTKLRDSEPVRWEQVLFPVEEA